MLADDDDFETELLAYLAEMPPDERETLLNQITNVLFKFRFQQKHGIQFNDLMGRGFASQERALLRARC